MKIIIIVQHITPWLYEFIYELKKKNIEVVGIFRIDKSKILNVLINIYLNFFNSKIKNIKNKIYNKIHIFDIKQLKNEPENIIINLTDKDFSNVKKKYEIKINNLTNIFLFFYFAKEYFFKYDFIETSVSLEDYLNKTKYIKVIKINFDSLSKINRNFFSKLFIFIIHIDSYKKLLEKKTSGEKYINLKFNKSFFNILKDYSFVFYIFILTKIRRALKGRVYYWNIKKIKNLDKVGISDGNIINKIDKKSYYADPFIYDYHNTIYVFYEKFNYDKNLGEIYCSKLIDNNLIQEKKINLDNNKHYSYPYIFDFNDEIFMIPETSSQNELQIWKCINFPYKWKFFHKLLIGKKVIDSSILIDKNKKIWLFTNIDEGYFEDHVSCLYIFYLGDSLKNEPVSHIQNPVKIDCSSSRGAGQIYFENKSLIRPSQINIKGVYGYGLNINYIESLNLNVFSEKTLKKVFPIGQFKIGIHHLSKNKNIILIDEHLI